MDVPHSPRSANSKAHLPARSCNGSRLLVLHPLGGLGRNRDEFADLLLHVCRPTAATALKRVSRISHIEPTLVFTWSTLGFRQTQKD